MQGRQNPMHWTDGDGIDAETYASHSRGELRICVDAYAEGVVCRSGLPGALVQNRAEARTPSGMLAYISRQKQRGALAVLRLRARFALGEMGAILKHAKAGGWRGSPRKRARCRMGRGAWRGLARARRPGASRMRGGLLQPGCPHPAGAAVRRSRCSRLA